MIIKAQFDPSDLITQAQAAEARGVTVAAINELIRRGRLSTVEMFGRKLLRRSDVEGFTPDKTGPKRKRPAVSKQGPKRPTKKKRTTKK